MKPLGNKKAGSIVPMFSELEGLSMAYTFETTLPKPNSSPQKNMPPQSRKVSQNDMFVSRSVFQNKGPVGTNLGGWDLCCNKPPPLASSRHSGGFSRLLLGSGLIPACHYVVIWKTH